MEAGAFARNGHHIGDSVPPQFVVSRLLVSKNSGFIHITFNNHKPRLILVVLAQFEPSHAGFLQAPLNIRSGRRQEGFDPVGLNIHINEQEVHSG